ncbi:hypothetical protein [Frigidibacter oleivorans]|uniref:hypothetical protein n=1 Tax=Frigidibacter oleivorans TaxID=2487129 RepID=UPI000F8D96DC|nr:hypothetical protein [Frigidibacter oleivorans]
MNTIWLLRAAKWARHPPSARRVALVFAVVAVCLGLAAVEWLGLWPAALTMDAGAHRGGLARP